MTPPKVGRYEIKSELGHGGMASVLQGFDPRFKRDVAVKILPAQFLHDPTFRARFEREAQTIAALEHPAIVPVYDYGEQDGQPYLVMRYMAGGSLSDRVALGPLPLVDVITIMGRIGSALDETHRMGIIHRDLKPANILFDARGDAFLSDFGIAKLAEQVSDLTVEGMALGTAQYMSPEQAEGLLTLDARSDIYSLGALLFHLLTGRLPYQAKTITGLMLAHIRQPVPLIRQIRPDLPPDCDIIIARSMAKKPAERYASAGELVEALAAAFTGEAGVAGHSIKPAAGPQPPPPAATAPTMMSSLTSTARKRGGMFGKFLEQGLDKLKETTTVTLSPTAAPAAKEGGPPAPYQLTGEFLAAAPEDLPATCEAAWEQGFQGFKDGNIQRWLELWEKYYQAAGDTARQEVCQAYLKHSVDLRGQLHFKSSLAQQMLFEKFLRLLGGVTPTLAAQPNRLDLGQIICTETGYAEIELQNSGPRGLIGGQITADKPWLVIGEKQTSLFTTFLPGSKAYSFYLRPGEVSRVAITAETESLKSGEYSASIFITPDGDDEQSVAIRLAVDVEALLNPARHQSAAASEVVCRKILAVEPQRLQVKIMLARAITELGLQLVKVKPKQAAAYAQEAKKLLAEVDNAGPPPDTAPAEIAAIKEKLARLWASLGNSTP